MSARREEIQGVIRKLAHQKSADRAMKRRTHQPVWRNSRHAGEIERREWAAHNRFARRENRARLRALAHLDREWRDAPVKTGKRRRPKSSVLHDVYEFMLKLRGREDGRLDPTYHFIARATGHSLSAVKRAMKRLSDFNLLRWNRRTELLEEPTPEGQYVSQISNAYVHELAGRAVALVKHFLGMERPRPDGAQATVNAAERLSRAERDEALAAAVSPELKSSLDRLRSRREGANLSMGLNAGEIGEK